LIDACAPWVLKNGSTAVIKVFGGEGDVGRLVTIALTSPAVLALKNAGVTTPVVFAFVTDPVGLGIVARW